MREIREGKETELVESYESDRLPLKTCQGIGGFASRYLQAALTPIETMTQETFVQAS